MATETIESLLIKIGVEVTDLRKGVKEGTDEIKKLDKTAKDAASSMSSQLSAGITAVTRGLGALGVVLSAQQLVQFTQQSLTAAVNLGRLSDAAGLSTRHFQELLFAFRDTGVQTEQFAQASATLSRNLSELQTGTGSFLQFLRESAPHLISQFRGVTDVNEAWRILADTLRGLPGSYDRIRVAQAAAGETGARLANELARGGANLRLAGLEAERLGMVMEDRTIRQARELETRMKELSTVLSNAFASAAVRAAEALGLLSRDQVKIRSEIDSSTRSITRLGDIISRLTEGSASRAVREKELNDELERRKRLIGELIALETTTVRTPDTSGLGDARDIQEQMARAQIAMTELQGQAVLFGEIFRGQLSILSEGWNAWTQELTSVHTPAFIVAMAEMEAAMKRQGATASQITLMKKNLAKQEQDLVLDTASLAASTLTQVFQGNKLAAIGAAVINTAVAITKALQLPWPFNWVQAGLVAASGVAQIASIRSATPTGGGAPASPSGSGAASAPSAPAAPEGSGQGGRSLHITGIDPSAFFSGRMVEGLIQAINEEVANGATLISTRNVPL